jgi:uncharacterized protein
MIVVVDTGVWVSALHFALQRGTPRLAIEKAAREHTIAICHAIEEEVLRILPAKFRWFPADVSAAMHAVFPFPLRVDISGNLSVCRDPNDDMVLECAVVSGAQVIVTGDKDLLVLDPYKRIRIVTPAEFLALDN